MERTDCTQRLDNFPDEVSERLKAYVYRLIDPRNGETFYVGKGRGNRVFAHIRADVPNGSEANGDDNDNKLERIRAIQRAGLEVNHVIHRHGMDDDTAYQVEAALMDAYPGLTNIAGGTDSGDLGVMHSKEVIARYSAEPAEFQDKALLITVNRSAPEVGLYEATRFAWKINQKRATEAEVVLPVIRGIIVGAFIPDQWLEATTENFPGREAALGRFGFIGHEAPQKYHDRYVGKRIPPEYQRKGAANPVKYTW